MLTLAATELLAKESNLWAVVCVPWLSQQRAGYLMWAGNSDPANAPFAVMRDGTMRNGANIYTMTFASEAGPGKPMTIPVFFPADLYTIDKVLLYVRMKPFRATATGAASGGGSAETSGNSAGSLATKSSDVVPSVSIGYAGAHNHWVDTTNAYTDNEAAHTHTPTVSMPAHIHYVNEHSHSVTLPAHTHGITYGIYEQAASGTFGVTVDGTTHASGVTNQTASNIATRFKTSGGKITRDTESRLFLPRQRWCALRFR